ncbi:MAG: hypothetical protein GX958_03215 [Desulfitobacterium sp.]|nr:hypothetical protein [Desulfitobacterium sp.]
MRGTHLKVARDMFLVQGIWTCYFLAIILAIHIIQTIITINLNGNLVDSGFFLSSHVSSRIYMLIIGIIAAIYFPPFYVGNGVTRKDSFRGILLGTLALAIALTLVTFCIGALESLLVKGLNLPISLEQGVLLDTDDLADIQKNILANIFLAFILPTAGEIGGMTVTVLIMSTVGKYLLYCAGYLIGASFCRFNPYLGVAITLITSLLVLVHSVFGGFPINDFLFGTGIITLNLSPALSFLGSVSIIAIILWAARMISRRTPFKV